MGIPHWEKEVNVILLIVNADTDQRGATGRPGAIPDSQSGVQ